MAMTADNNMQIPLDVIANMRTSGYSEDGIKQALGCAFTTNWELNLQAQSYRCLWKPMKASRILPTLPNCVVASSTLRYFSSSRIGGFA
jgi:hypothetical protein